MFKYQSSEYSSSYIYLKYSPSFSEGFETGTFFQTRSTNHSHVRSSSNDILTCLRRSCSQNRSLEKEEEEKKEKEGKEARELEPGEGMLKTGRVAHSAASREATESGGGSPYYVPFPRSYYSGATHTVSLAHVCIVCLCVPLCVCVCVCCVRLLMRPTYRRLLATLLRRAHRLAGTRRTCPHRRVVSDSTGCPGKNLPDPENPAIAQNEISRRGRPAAAVRAARR